MGDDTSPSGGFGRALGRAGEVAGSKVAAARRALERAWALYRRKTARAHPYDSIALGFLGAAFVLYLTLAFFAWAASPDLSADIVERSGRELAEVARLRRTEIDPANPPILVKDVDYSLGGRAPWFPKGEAPILAELVREGALPPVAERVGPEPVVVEGVEGAGTYGGTWIRAANSPGDVGVMRSRLAYGNLLRWSPQGYPIVPHVAKSYAVSPDAREFTFELRRGMKWSDGHPFTADDIMFWWEHECNDETVMATPPQFMKVRGKAGKVEKLGDYRVRFSFPEPKGLFPALLATHAAADVANAPAHYLRRFHPTVGDDDAIETRMKARRLQSRRAVYFDVKSFFNPEHPRLWPWIYRTYKPNPPQAFVRNPYYFMVDTGGNQLPYVDRMLFEVKSPDMIAITVANGEVTMQARHIRYDEYTLLMSNRERYGFEVLHWFPGDRSQYAISPNLNRRVDPSRPDTKHKHEILNDKRFRQALSLAINREDIIKAELNGQAEPAQVAPSPASYFHDPLAFKAFTEYDPERANRLLDETGLTSRDREGYRTFKDGSYMVFFLNYCGFTGPGPGQFIVEDWGRVGVRAMTRQRSRPLFYTEKAALVHDFNVWGGNGEYFPLVEPRYFVPVRGESNYAIAFARWYERGGLFGDPKADPAFGCVEPPAGHPIRRAMEAYEEVLQEADPERQRDRFREVLRIAAENVWTINISTPPPVLAVVKDGFRNVPRNAVYSWDFQSPANTGIETYFFEEPSDSAGAVADTRRAIVEATPPPDAPSSVAKTRSGSWLGAIVRYVLLLGVVALVVMVGVKHPYIGRRLVIMVPTLLVISVVAFSVIQLPPGDFITTCIMQLQESGEEADLQQIDELKELFHLEESLPKRYVRWLGLVWFTTLDEKDAGLLQGNMGRSMESGRLVNDIVGDRILLTVLISLGTIFFTWLTAIPIGIYSAVRQYSAGDYALTFLGFIGMCVPNFLLALLLMYVSAEWFGMPVSGLFSSQYGAQPEWTWGKFVDLLKHIWVPVVVLGVGGTAGMIRVMRANLLDELKKPYVITAMAKGVRPMKLLLKYPVRLALNPFISGIGGLFPMLVSGGAIVAMVLSLPTVGPLMLSALFSEDMYLAGSMLMVLSLLGILGTLVSDLLLLWLDPRIRFKGGTR